MAHLPLSELSTRFGLELRGDGGTLIGGVGTLRNAAGDQLSFYANSAYREELESTRAGAVVLAEDDLDRCPTNALLAPDPYLAYARIATLYDRRAAPAPGIDPSAVVDPTAKLGSEVHVGATAVVGPGCQLGDGVSIGPGCVLLPNCTVGGGSRLVARVTLCEGVKLGRRVLVHPGAVIGADGFGIARTKSGWEKVPQLGAVRVGDDCEIGANSCVDRGAIEDTVLENDVRIDNLCQIGHNCHVGAHTAMAAYTGISGSTQIGENCLFAGRSGAHGHIRIADGVTVAAMTMVKKSIEQAGTVWSAGLPAQPIGEWQRTAGQLRRLDKTMRRLRAALRELATGDGTGKDTGKDGREDGQSTS